MDSGQRHSGWITVALVVSVIALLCDLVWFVSMMLGEDAKFVVFMISIFAILLIVPVFVFDFAGFVCSFITKDSRRVLLRILSGAGIGLLMLAGVLLFGGRVNVEKLEKNYLKHSGEMEQAIDYTLSWLEEGRGLDIEFNDRGQVEIFHVCKDGVWNGVWDPSRSQVDSLAEVIGLSREHLDGIRNRLKKAACHSIDVVKQDGAYDVATLMFRRDMGSAYSYDIHYVAMAEAEMEAVNADDCTRIAFDSHVCFVYGSPAWGSICFPGKKEYLSK